MKTEASEIHDMVRRPCRDNEFDVDAFLREGSAAGYLLHALDGKPFLVKYKPPLMKDGRLERLVIWLIDPGTSKKDLVWPSYVSKTFSHFFGPDKSSEDYLELDDGGLVVAEILLEADESGILFLIADLNYKHIQKPVLGKYYGTHRGEYDFIGRSMVAIAGKVLFEEYGVGLLGVKTDKTKGFYWEIAHNPPNKPAIPKITKQLRNVRDIRTRREIRDNFYINVVKKIALHRFDPYMSLDSSAKVEESWERHCVDIWNILLNNELLISSLLEASGIIVAEGPKDFINRMMVKYRAKNIDWFTSINSAMLRLAELNLAEDRLKIDSIIDEMMGLEIDPIIKGAQAKLREAGTSSDIIAVIHRIIALHRGIFPVIDLSKIEEIDIGIRPHKENAAQHF